MGAVQTANTATFESFWTALQELTASQKETDRILKENAERSDRRQEETDRQMQETERILRKNAEQQEKTDKVVGKLGKRMGEVIEYMVAPNLRQKFRDYDLYFPSISMDSEVNDVENDLSFEIDVKLENGDKAMLVEVKTKPSTEDVQDHIERLGKMRKYADLHGDKRIFLGAVAGVVMSENVKKYVLKQGFFAIEPSGETFNITPPKGQPKEW